MPLLSGFTAVPNPQMLAFMATQSFVMMMQAGEGWQYGKRKQSAMTNEEFNKQTPLSIMERQMSELKQAIPSIIQNMNNMTPMVGKIVEQYGDFVKAAFDAAPVALEKATEGLDLSGIPIAFGDTGITQKQFKQESTIQWQPLVEALAKWLLGGAIIKTVSDRDTHITDKTPEQTLFENIPDDENISGAEFTKATNEAEFNKRQEDKKLQDRIAEIERLQRLKAQPSEDALRRKSIVESGLSPLAFKARETFRTNIDNANSSLQKSISQVSGAKQNQPSNKGSHAYQLWQIKLSAALKLQIARVQKLSSLRIKYFKVYGEHY